MAILAGWVTTEVGRQPWVVYGLLRTNDAVSAHGDLQMSISLLAFFVVYSSVFGVGYVYMMRLIKKGPLTGEGKDVRHGGPGQGKTPARPLSAAHESLNRTAGAEINGYGRSFRYLVCHHRLCHADVHRDGRLRSGHRHAVSVHERCGRARCDGEQRGAGLGRQRNLAGAGRCGGCSAPSRWPMR